MRRGGERRKTIIGFPWKRNNSTIAQKGRSIVTLDKLHFAMRTTLRLGSVLPRPDARHPHTLFLMPNRSFLLFQN